MSASIIQPLVVPASGSGTPVPVGELRDKTAQVTVVSGTYQLQYSLDGVGWVDTGATMAGAGVYGRQVAHFCKLLRLTATVAGSGTALVGGFTNRE